MFGINFNQAMMAVVAVVSAAAIFFRHRRARQG
jgi:hypothetical protein